MSDKIIIEPQKPARYAMIFLHGLGADGHDFYSLSSELTFPGKSETRFIFPHAPIRPVTINGGMAMRAWFDLPSLQLGQKNHFDGFDISCSSAQSWLDEQIASGIPSQHIFLGGFSQGGVIALSAGLDFAKPLGGIIALSTFLPDPEGSIATFSAASRNTPIFMAHGTMDPMINLHLAVSAKDALKKANYKVDWHEYPMPHSVCAEELGAISMWLANKA